MKSEIRKNKLNKVGPISSPRLCVRPLPACNTCGTKRPQRPAWIGPAQGQFGRANSGHVVHAGRALGLVTAPRPAAVARFALRSPAVASPFGLHNDDERRWGSPLGKVSVRKTHLSSSTTWRRRTCTAAAMF
jgi:hypothetical protein